MCFPQWKLLSLWGGERDGRTLLTKPEASRKEVVWLGPSAQAGKDRVREERKG